MKGRLSTTINTAIVSGVSAICLFGGFSAAAQQTLPSGPESLPDPIPAEVESLYTKGLGYLAGTQTAEGCWPDRFGRFPGVVGLALMAVLAHGDDPNHGPHAEMVRRAVAFLLAAQNAETGYIGDSMYHHGFATIALAEAYGALEEERLGPALQKATDLILTAQERNPRDAWRYQPESQDADTTVSGAQMTALFAARNAGLHIPDEAIEKGLAFYLTCQSPGGGFGYSSAGSPNATRTAIGVLMFSLAKRKDAPGLDQSFRYLAQDLDYRDRTYPFYFEYYMAQALFHFSPATWEDWNRRNTAYLAGLQEADGHWDCAQGPTFATAAALLSLALNYRFLPIYER